MKMQKYLIWFSILLVSLSANALAVSLDVHLAFSDDGKKLGITTLTSQVTVPCTVSLYASFDRAKAASQDASTLLVSNSDKVLFSANGLKPFSSFKKRSKLYVNGVVTCNDSSSALDTSSITVVRTRKGRGTKDQLLRALRSNISPQSVILTDAFPQISFDSPVDFQIIPGSRNDRIFVVQQDGRIYSVERGQKTLFLDISDKVQFAGEQGLLGLAFHPNYRRNGFFFVHYSLKSNGNTVVSRYKVTNNIVDTSSETIILTQTQPFSNHNGGQITFGNDGFLYISLGDGGSGGDPQGNGQSLSTFLGKILRIDINRSSNGNNYAIPRGNPYRGNQSGFKEEIYAYGLRNVWKFSFDPKTQKLWAGDVGQGQYEEIDIIRRGANYGWNTMEGLHCFSPSSNCNQAGLTLPVTEYDHSGDDGSVTGGFVYRANKIIPFKGLYIFGDFSSGRLLAVSAANPAQSPTELLDTDEGISSFGRDRKGELYILSYGSGKIYKIRT